MAGTLLSSCSVGIALRVVKVRQVGRVQVVTEHIVCVRVLVREHVRVLGVVAVQRVGANHSQYDSNAQSSRYSCGRIHDREEHQQPGESSCKNRNVHSNNCKLAATDINHNRCGKPAPSFQRSLSPFSRPPEGARCITNCHLRRPE